MKAHLNFMMGNSVVSHTCYEAVFTKWFYVRVQYYMKRLLRRLEILKAKQIRNNNVIRYIAEYNILDIPGKTMAQMSLILAAAGFDTIAIGALRPKHVATCDIVMLATQGDYKYLLGLSSLDKTTEAIEKNKRKRDSLAAKYAECLAELDKPIPGADIWLRELDQLRIVVTEGTAISWQPDAEKFDL